MSPLRVLPLVLALVAPVGAGAQEERVLPPVAPYPPAVCPSCAGWNEPTEPVPIHGDTYWVGTRGLGAVLVTSPDGHVLLDGGLPESAPLIAENIRSLGLDPADIRLIVNSHPHYDHAGGIAHLQALSGARVVASPPSAAVLGTGEAGPDDPQADVALPFPPVEDVETLAWGDTVRIGPLALVAHATPGHTPGGTSWSWRSCDGDGCVHVVYADSQTPVSGEGFLYGGSAAWPGVVAAFRRGIRTLEALPCDILLTPHPGASDLWSRVREGRLVDPGACRRYAERAREALDRRLKEEAEGRHGPARGG